MPNSINELVSTFHLFSDVPLYIHTLPFLSCTIPFGTLLTHHNSYYGYNHQSALPK